MYSKSSRLDFHATKCFAMLSGICSYQSKFWWHKLWITLLPSSINGAASPVCHILNSMMATFLAWSKVSLSCVLESPLCHLQYSKIHPVLFHYQGFFLATFYLELLAACLFMELKLSVPYYCLQIWLICTSPAHASNIFFPV